jgi:uncharacterized protein (DUF2147 family)
MKMLCLGLAFAAAAAPTIGFGGVEGVWRTETSDSGGYLEVAIEPCESDPGTVCGVIAKAINQQGEDPDYENLGKLILWDMHPQGEDGYGGGKIWDPEKDKTYTSKMRLKNDVLDVEGCVAFICRGEAWIRVN